MKQYTKGEKIQCINWMIKEFRNGVKTYDGNRKRWLCTLFKIHSNYSENKEDILDLFPELAMRIRAFTTKQPSMPQFSMEQYLFEQDRFSKYSYEVLNILCNELRIEVLEQTLKQLLC